MRCSSFIFFSTERTLLSLRPCSAWPLSLADAEHNYPAPFELRETTAVHTSDSFDVSLLFDIFQMRTAISRSRPFAAPCDPAAVVFHDKGVTFLRPPQPFLSKGCRGTILQRRIAVVTVLAFVAVSRFVAVDHPNQLDDQVDQLISKYSLTKSALNCGGQIRQLNQDPPWDHDEGLALLCCIAVNEGPYISEFVDYHLGLGFGKIVVYDNSDSFELEEWGHTKSYNGRVETIHYPGPGQQQYAYLDCAQRALRGTFGKKKWAAFFDVDEFLVLKRHENVEALLGEHLAEGSLSLNWIKFPPSGKLFCEPSPVTKRFVYHDPETNRHVKTIVRLQDMNMTRPPHVHFPYLKDGNLTYRHDTNKKILTGPFNENGPTDIAVIHHYHTKSYGEYVMKRHRGASDNTFKSLYTKSFNEAISLFEEALKKNGIDNHTNELAGLILDDTAWTMLKKVSPKYALYEP